MDKTEKVFGKLYCGLLDRSKVGSHVLRAGNDEDDTAKLLVFGKMVSCKNSLKEMSLIQLHVQGAAAKFDYFEISH